MNPTFEYEKRLWKKGLRFVAGADEVGRGCFAGPVVAAACAFAQNSNFQIPIFNEKGEKVFINDSKKLTPKQRDVASRWIKETALTWGIGEVRVSEINRLGMSKATQKAFRGAVANANKRLEMRREKWDNEVGSEKSRIQEITLQGHTSHISHHTSKIDFLLIDAFYIQFVKGLRRKNQNAIINGDERSVSIAAASIIAKVYRDNLMINLSKNRKYKRYGWDKNKGYGTKVHREAILKYGPTQHHRISFIDKT